MSLTTTTPVNDSGLLYPTTTNQSYHCRRLENLVRSYKEQFTEDQIKNIKQQFLLLYPQMIKLLHKYNEHIDELEHKISQSIENILTTEFDKKVFSFRLHWYRPALLWSKRVEFDGSYDDLLEFICKQLKYDYVALLNPCRMWSITGRY